TNSEVQPIRRRLITELRFRSCKKRIERFEYLRLSVRSTFGANFLECAFEQDPCPPSIQDLIGGSFIIRAQVMELFSIEFIRRNKLHGAAAFKGTPSLLLVGQTHLQRAYKETTKASLFA